MQQPSASGVATPQLSVSITNSTITGNSATGGAGGAGGYTTVYDEETGGYGKGGSSGGAGGSSTGAGLDITAANAVVTIAGSTISQNSATGGAGGAGHAGILFGLDFNGGVGGNGGSVQGAGLALQVGGTVTVTGTTFQGNSATGGAGGAGNIGGTGVGNTSGGTGGAGGGGGSVAGAALFSSNSATTLTLSGVTAQQNSATGGAGGAGGQGGFGADNADQFKVENIALEAVPIPGIGFIALSEVGDVSNAGVGGFGGVGGLVAGAVAVGGATQISGSAIVQNQAQGGTGGNGGLGGNGGNSASGASGGNAGSGGGAGEGGFAYGAGLTTFNGTVLVTNSTLDGNTAVAGGGGTFGTPGEPGVGQPTFASQYFYPALSVLLAVVPGVFEVGEAVEATIEATELGFHGVEATSAGTNDFLQFGELSPGIVGGSAAAGSAAVAGIAAGAGVFAQGGTVTLVNDTITRNSADISGGVYVGANATLSLGNTIVAQDTTTKGLDPDIGSSNYVVTSLGHNLIGSLMSDVVGLNQPGDIAGSASVPLNPDLGPLQLNGGTTLNRKPIPDSTLLGDGSSALVSQYGLTTDQAGFSRSVNGIVDIGADEALTGLQGATLTVNSTDGTENPTNVLTLAEAVALTNGTLAYSQLTAQQQALVSLGTGSGPDTIQFASSLAGQTISLFTAQASFFGPTALPIDVPVTIIGPSGGLTISRASSASNLRLLRGGQHRPAHAGEPDAQPGPGGRGGRRDREQRRRRRWRRSGTGRGHPEFRHAVHPEFHPLGQCGRGRSRRRQREVHQRALPARGDGRARRRSVRGSGRPERWLRQRRRRVLLRPERRGRRIGRRRRGQHPRACRYDRRDHPRGRRPGRRHRLECHRLRRRWRRRRRPGRRHLQCRDRHDHRQQPHRQHRIRRHRGRRQSV